MSTTASAAPFEMTMRTPTTVIGPQKTETLRDFIGDALHSLYASPKEPISFSIAVRETGSVKYFECDADLKLARVFKDFFQGFQYPEDHDCATFDLRIPEHGVYYERVVFPLKEDWTEKITLQDLGILKHYHLEISKIASVDCKDLDLDFPPAQLDRPFIQGSQMSQNAPNDDVGEMDVDSKAFRDNTVIVEKEVIDEAAELPEVTLIDEDSQENTGITTNDAILIDDSTEGHSTSLELPPGNQEQHTSRKLLPTTQQPRPQLPNVIEVSEYENTTIIERTPSKSTPQQPSTLNMLESESKKDPSPLHQVDSSTPRATFKITMLLEGGSLLQKTYSLRLRQRFGKTFAAFTDALKSSAKTEVGNLKFRYNDQLLTGDDTPTSIKASKTEENIIVVDSVLKATYKFVDLTGRNIPHGYYKVSPRSSIKKAVKRYLKGRDINLDDIRLMYKGRSVKLTETYEQHGMKEGDSIEIYGAES